MNNANFPYLKVQGVPMSTGIDMHLMANTKDRIRAIRFAVESANNQLVLIDEFNGLEGQPGTCVSGLLCQILSSQFEQTGSLAVHVLGVEKVEVQHYSKELELGFLDIVTVLREDPDEIPPHVFKVGGIISAIMRGN